MNLAFIGSESEAVRYGSITNRLKDATWRAFVPLGESNSGVGKNALDASVETESVESLLSQHSGDVDAFVIQAPALQLQETVKTASLAGKPILAGPLFAKKSQELSDLGTAAKTRLVPGCPWRFVPAIQSVKASIDAEKLGPIGLIRIHRWNSKSTVESGDAADRIIPMIDLATWFFGDRPTKVFSFGSKSDSGYIQVHLQFEGDGMVVIDDTAALPEGGDYFSLTVIGGTGAAYADDHRNMNLIVDGVHPHAVRTGQGNIDIASQLQGFVDTVTDANPPAFTLQNLAELLQVSDAALEASADQAAVWKDGSYA